MTQITSRRERQRQATMDEIVTTARGQLGRPGGLSLRAIAQEMGMTAPALYRYVDSVDDLALHVAASVYDDLVDELEAAAARYPGDPEAQMLAGSVAYRQWSLAHRAEFALCFASEIHHPDSPDDNVCAIAGWRFRGFFTEIFVARWHQAPFDVPSEEDLGPAAAAALTDPMNPFIQDHSEWLKGDLPVGAHWIFLRAWTQLYGIVTLEVFGHVSSALVTSGVLFRDVLRDCGRSVGITDSDGRLAAVVETELSR